MTDGQFFASSETVGAGDNVEISRVEDLRCWSGILDLAFPPYVSEVGNREEESCPPPSLCISIRALLFALGGGLETVTDERWFAGVVNV